MRISFIKTLTEIAEKDERIWLVCGDLGYSVLEEFANKFPNRYINAGVAEQNMTGLSAGLALEGKIVFTYSIANFPTLRCLEQIRNDICYHNLNVNIVSVGGGFSYGSQGYTHHGIEDIGIMCMLPNMDVIAPADPIETKTLLRKIVEKEGPSYLRLGKAREPVIHQTNIDLEIGKGIKLIEGGDVAIISTGCVLNIALKSAKALLEKGISSDVISMPSIKPIDKDLILKSSFGKKLVITIEEHRSGGLGTYIALILIENEFRGKFKSINVGENIFKKAGSQDYLNEIHGISESNLCQAVESMINDE